jgi:hypothetical protein
LFFLRLALRVLSIKISLFRLAFTRVEKENARLAMTLQRCSRFVFVPLDTMETTCCTLDVVLAKLQADDVTTLDWDGTINTLFQLMGQIYCLGQVQQFDSCGASVCIPVCAVQMTLETDIAILEKVLFEPMFPKHQQELVKKLYIDLRRDCFARRLGEYSRGILY